MKNSEEGYLGKSYVHRAMDGELASWLDEQSWQTVKPVWSMWWRGGLLVEPKFIQNTPNLTIGRRPYVVLRALFYSRQK